jgi:hypothetical protein
MTCTSTQVHDLMCTMCHTLKSQWQQPINVTHTTLGHSLRSADTGHFNPLNFSKFPPPTAVNSLDIKCYWNVCRKQLRFMLYSLPQIIDSDDLPIFHWTIMYSRTPLIWTLVIKIVNYPNRLCPWGLSAKNSTKLTRLEITGFQNKYSTALSLLEFRIRRGRKV